MSFKAVRKTQEEVICEVVDEGELKSRRHLNVRGKSATLPSITGAAAYPEKGGASHAVFPSVSPQSC